MSCPVCFNAAATDDTVRQSLNLGIVVLMGVTGIVLAGFLGFIISVVRRSTVSTAEAEPDDARRTRVASGFSRTTT